MDYRTVDNPGTARTLKEARPSRFKHRSGFTLVEMLVVMALIAMLAGTLSVAALYARRLSVRVECQSNMREIGTSLLSLAMADNGYIPEYQDADNVYWWQHVFASFNNTEPTDLDDNPTSPGIQLSKAFDVFHCRAAGTFQTSSIDDLNNSLSYGINFDVKRADGTPYTSIPESPDLVGGDPSNTDKDPDRYNMAEIKSPANFILLAEANTGVVSVFGGGASGDWTGGRVAMAATETQPDNALHPAHVPAMHDGHANVLFADFHVSPMPVNDEVIEHGTATGGALGSLTDSSKNWDRNPPLPPEINHTGHILRITGGTQRGQRRLITSNNDTTLSFTPDLPAAPVSGDTYQIVPDIAYTLDVNRNTPLWTLPDD